jgi:hypothetical protein
LIQKRRNPEPHAAEERSENECSFVLLGKTPRHVKVAVAIKEEFSYAINPVAGSFFDRSITSPLRVWWRLQS